MTTHGAHFTTHIHADAAWPVTYHCPLDRNRHTFRLNTGIKDDIYIDGTLEEITSFAVSILHSVINKVQELAAEAS